MRENLNKHVHDCTGPDKTCPCGFVFRVPPVWVHIEIGENQELLFGDAFNCERVSGAVQALRDAADKLERMRR